MKKGETKRWNFHKMKVGISVFRAKKKDTRAQQFEIRKIYTICTKIWRWYGFFTQSMNILQLYVDAVRLFPESENTAM